ncbi:MULTISPECIES: hypothetical protein [unclassified Micromonospora]|uniref:hypothetical protein n=1 Tax=unclassified Micromonospora TaxID=2617518 RepID=UPI002FF05F66
MRRAVSSVTVALGLLGATVASTGVAVAAPATSAPAPKKRCTVTDERLREMSGLVATKSGYIVVNDSSLQESRKRVFYLDTKCRISKEPVRYSGDGPFDTEDLAVSPNGKTLWIADIGDNPGKDRRSRIAVWTMPLDGGKAPVLHRLSYPEGKPHDAEALLVGADNLPLVITKVPSGKAGIYTPTGKLRNGDTEPVPMKKVGEIALPETSTDNPMNIFGRVAITGAARSPDGSKVVLRTYADAFEYDVTGDDIVAALTTGKPRVTPLSDPFGEAISYTPDGKTFLTVSDAGTLSADDQIDILAYTPSKTGAEALAKGADAKKPAAEKSWFDTLSLDQITYLIGAIGVLGALLVAAGIIGILRSRRRPAPTDDSRDDRDGDDVLSSGAIDRGPDDGFGPGDAGRDGPRGGVYGGAPAGGGVYGAPKPAGGAPGRPGGGVYGGARPGAAPGAGRPDGPGAPGGGRPAGPGGRPGGGVYGGGRPAGGGVYGGAPAGAAQGGPGPRAGGPGGPPSGGGPRGGAPNGGGPRGGGGVYGAGGRSEPPRRHPRDPRSGPRHDEGYDERRGGQYGYGQPPGRGERY